MVVEPLPIIDCSIINKNINDFAQKLGKAFEEFGFVYLINHEFKKEAVDNFTEKILQFYNLPLDVKLKYKMDDPFGNFFGYTPAGVERFGDDSNTKKKRYKRSI